MPRVGDRTPAFFLDFDGTLAPIASRPDLVRLPPRSRSVLRRLGETHLVCLLSGRGLPDLEARVDLPGVFYAGDHGFRIAGPMNSGVRLEVGAAARETLAAAAAGLHDLLDDTPGVIIEEKGLSLSVHYRLTPPVQRRRVRRAVDRVSGRMPGLLQTGGKLVRELRPGEDWDKGRAMLWLLDQLGCRPSGVCPICLGDDLTDEDAFLASTGWGISIVVGPTARRTAADYRLPSVAAAVEFLARFLPQD
jgi:trehalose 6-phosphate phosphatase